MVPADTEHDRHIAENYIFNDVLVNYVSRAEYVKQARFNADGHKPTKDEITSFLTRAKNHQPNSAQHGTPTSSTNKRSTTSKLTSPYC